MKDDHLFGWGAEIERTHRLHMENLREGERLARSTSRLMWGSVVMLGIAAVFMIVRTVIEAIGAFAP